MVRSRILALALAGLMPAAAHAQQITPLIYELSAEGQPGGQQLQVANTGTSPIAFEISASRRSYDELGHPVEAPAGDAVRLFPDALWLEPGESRQVSVAYAGGAVTQSELYVVRFRQAPVRTGSDDDRTGIDLQYEFLTIAHLHPAAGQPAIEVTGATGEGAQATVVLTNRGARTGRIDEGSLTLQGAGRTLVIAPTALADEHRATWLLPGASRILRIALPTDIAGQPITAQWRRASTAPDAQ